MAAAIRDVVRSTFVGPIIRDYIIKPYWRIQARAESSKFRATGSPRFSCPLCGYVGAFVNYPTSLLKGPNRLKDTRHYALCPGCGSLERHRLQSRTLDVVLPGFACEEKSVLHFAPEPFLQKRLRSAFGIYRTADLFRKDVDVRADMCDLPLPDQSVDLVYASHVLEHVPDDRKAIAELFRILKPGGMAIIPVPIYTTGATVEYDRPRPEEDGHVRGPGLDYFDRYREVFDDVVLYTSNDFPTQPTDNQLFIRVESSHPGAPDEMILDYVPVCRRI
jgi:SAM-dependent methyltransferase